MLFGGAVYIFGKVHFYALNPFGPTSACETIISVFPGGALLHIVMGGDGGMVWQLEGGV